MTAIHPIRLTLMIVLAVLAILLAFTDLAISVIALGDIQRWASYIPLYLGSIILAIVFTALVYVARDFSR